MALVDINATVRLGGVFMAFDHLTKTDFRSTFLRLRRPMHWDQMSHRDKQESPRGRWQQLAPSTRAKYAKQGKRRNRRILARLPNARQTSVTSQALTMKSRVRRWSNAHQDGPTRVGRGARLPQRQFFWISARFRKEAKHQFELTLISRWNAIRGRSIP